MKLMEQKLKGWPSEMQNQIGEAIERARLLKEKGYPVNERTLSLNKVQIKELKKREAA